MQVLRFALIGGLVALSYLLMYLAFLALGMPRGLSNGLAFFLAICLQYAGQAGFTFRKRLYDSPQILRFAVMVGLGFVMSALITGWLGPRLGLANWMAAAIVTVVLPVQNFVLMTLWVFARQHQAKGNLS